MRAWTRKEYQQRIRDPEPYPARPILPAPSTLVRHICSTQPITSTAGGSGAGIKAGNHVGTERGTHTGTRTSKAEHDEDSEKKEEQ